MSLYRPVYGAGPRHADVMIISDSPGYHDVRTGQPLSTRGAVGRFLNTILRRAKIPREDCYVTYLCKTRTVDKKEKDRAPTSFEIRQWQGELWREIRGVNPRYILGLGASVGRWLLGARWADLETLHGLAHELELGGADRVVIPCYGPGSGLHNPEMAGYFYYDMLRAGMVIRGEIDGLRSTDFCAGYEDYSEGDLLLPGGVVEVASDTEGYKNDPWYLSYAFNPGVARVIRADDVASLRRFRRWMRDKRWIFQGATHDLPVYRAMGIEIGDDDFHDTQIMQYVLQVEPRDLKSNARRHCGMVMDEYLRIAKPVDRGIALRYLDAVTHRSAQWPGAEGRKHSVAKRAESIVFACSGIGGKKSRARAKKQKSEKNPRTLWDKVPAALRAPVEAKLGAMPALGLADLPQPRFMEYAARDADATLRIKAPLWRAVRAMGLQEVYEMDRAIVPMIDRMQTVGMRVDVVKLAEFEESMHRELTQIRGRCAELTRRKDFNPNSTQQVGDFLFVSSKGPKFNPKVFTDGGLPSTDDEVLKALMGQHPVIWWITEYREVLKLIGFVNALKREIAISGDMTLYPRLRTTTVVTGRLAAEGLNVLALPTHSDRAKGFKSCFIAPPGMVLGTADLDQIEFKVVADESGDEVMLDVFRTDKDMHWRTASEIFKVPYDKIQKPKGHEACRVHKCPECGKHKDQHRTPAKVTGFRVLYGGGAGGLLSQLEALGISAYDVDDCQGFIDEWFRLYSGVDRYMGRKHAETRRNGYVRDRWGRLRYLPGIWSEDKYLRAKAERDAGNFPIQAGAQGVIKRAMRRLWPELKALRADGIAADVLLQIHDELLFQAPIKYAKLVGKLVVDALCADSEMFKIPITAKCVYGANWGDLSK